MAPYLEDYDIVADIALDMMMSDKTRHFVDFTDVSAISHGTVITPEEEKVYAVTIVFNGGSPPLNIIIDERSTGEDIVDKARELLYRKIKTPNLRTNSIIHAVGSMLMDLGVRLVEKLKAAE